MNNKTNTPLESIRREYGSYSLDETQVLDDPLQQFQLWFKDALTTETEDPGAMVLSTVDAGGDPDARVVLLKGFDAQGFVFYTHYGSVKAAHIAHNPHVALTFYWARHARQVRIRGVVSHTTATESSDYFQTRPKLSQIAAMAAVQSTVIPDRSSLEHAFDDLAARFEHEKMISPDNWGGYRCYPYTIEFWQGRDNRLHDRLVYTREDDTTSWRLTRLAP